MRCPTCQAKLLPVDGELFCLQCGTAVRAIPEAESDSPQLEETTDPLLQKAITDAVRRPVNFRTPVERQSPETEVASLKQPVNASQPSAKPKKTHTFNSMRSILAASAPAVATLSSSGPIVNLANAVPVNPPVVEPVPHFSANSHAKDGMHLPVAWVLGVAIFTAFVVANAGLGWFFAYRAYPGVRVANIAVGTLTSGQIASTVGRKVTVSNMALEVGGQRYEVGGNQLGTINANATAANALSAGKTIPLPMAAVIESYFMAPIKVQYSASLSAISAEAKQLAASVDHPAVNAVVVAGTSGVVLIGQKDGASLDMSAAVAHMIQAFGATKPVSLSTEDIVPSRSNSAFSSLLSQAQKLESLNLTVTVRSSSYTASAATIGGWLVLTPGQAVSVNASSVAAYVGALPGAFDRQATANALLSALRGGTNLTYSASTGKNIALPKSSSVNGMALANYRVCASGEVATVSSSALADPKGWSLGGKLAFTSASSACNVTLALVNSGGMSRMAPTCAGQAVCQVGNIVGLNALDWQKAPTGWVGSQVSYQIAMVDRGIGYWLGFDSASCVSKSGGLPILSLPALSVDSCAANWYAIAPKELSKPHTGS